MKIYVTSDYEELSSKSAQLVAAQIILNPSCVLGLATGSTPTGLYSQLISWYKSGDLDFSSVGSVNLDEYVGLEPTHEQSYRYFMEKHLFAHINILPNNTNLPNGLAADLGAECVRYDQVIQDYGGIDIQILGIGHNGHIGFNEPGEMFELQTHLVHLQDSTIEANSRFFAAKGEVPKRAITMGIKSIMQARQILLVVSGKDKADIVQAAFEGPVTPRVPASVLQLHPNTVLVGDKDALSKLHLS